MLPKPTHSPAILCDVGYSAAKADIRSDLGHGTNWCREVYRVTTYPVGVSKGPDLDRVGVISMQLTKFSDYSLRVLMYTHAAGGRRVTIEEMATAYRISRAHLMKVVNSLARADYLTALRGRSEGVVLARPAEDICLGEVVRATEPGFAIVECFSTNNKCVFTDYCRLPRVLDQALTAFLTVLDQHTLASVAIKPKDFRAVFQTARRPTASRKPTV